MLSAVLVAALILAAPVKGVEEVWQGTLNTDFFKAKGKKKKSAPKKAVGSSHKLTLRIKRHGDKFTGVWDEGDRSLDIAGDVNYRVFKVTHIEVKSGKWKAEVLKDLQISGEFDKDDPGILHGGLFGKSKKLERSGEFTVMRKGVKGDEE
jgi:hypothetical protein